MWRRAAARGQQAGAALLAAMLTVTLVASFAAAAMWQQWRSVEVETAERARIQAAWILIGALARISKPQPQFASWVELKSVMQMLVPLSIYIVAVVYLGLYVSSFVLIAYFMKVHGKFGVIGTVLTSVGVPLAAFMLFERWFLVPLPKGPIEQMLGL